MNWRLGLGFLLLVIAIFTGWSAWKHRSGGTAAEAPRLRPDYVMRDFEMVSLDDKGQEAMTLKAPLMQRNPTDQTYLITTPLFLLPDPEGQPWELRAKSGWVSAKGEELRLRGGVTGNSPVGAETPTEFKTSHLNAFPDRNRIETDAAVTITRPGSILGGTGFEADTRTKQYSFKSQVRSRYVPKSAH